MSVPRTVGRAPSLNHHFGFGTFELAVSAFDSGCVMVAIGRVGTDRLERQ